MKPNLAPVLVLVDIDGVLNIAPSGCAAYEDWEPREPLPDGYVEREVTLPAALLPETHLLRGHGRHDLTATVKVNPALHGTWLNRLAADPRTEPMFASTWEGGSRVLADLLNLTRPIAWVPFARAYQSPGLPGKGLQDDAGRVKRLVLSQLYTDRHWVWLDDSWHTGPRIWRGGATDSNGRRRPGGWHRFIPVDSRQGLMPAHIHSVDQFVRHAYGQPLGPAAASAGPTVP